jgi:acetyl esterase/lipase
MVLWRPAEPMPPDACQVEVVRDVAYYDGPEADDHRHRLDLFLPKEKANCPVVMLVHGGAWVVGDNRCCGLYSSVGQFLASRGIVAVLPNYRLSPGSKHPDHIQDVARAFAWTRKHITNFGGRPDQIILAGHSAGGHLVALLATDEKYLKAEGQRLADIRGVMAVSGVYHIPTVSQTFTLGGASSRAASLDEMTPLRGAGGWSWSRRLGLPGIPVNVDAFGLAFGDDAETREDASPVNHVRSGLPPFLIFYGENDLPTLPDMAREFYAALVGQGCEAKLFQVKERNHNSIMFRAIEPQDPVAHAMLEFIKHCAPREPNP